MANREQRFGGMDFYELGLRAEGGLKFGESLFRKGITGGWRSDFACG